MSHGLSSYPTLHMNSGVLFEYGNPACGIAMEDIFHHLARSNRFGGATVEPYSVAQHSDWCGDQVGEWGGDALARLYARIHDAHEAVITDIMTPAQEYITLVNGGDNVLKIVKDRLDQQIIPHTGLPWPADPERWALVKAADAAAFACEARQLFRELPYWYGSYCENVKPIQVDKIITPLNYSSAEVNFRSGWETDWAAWKRGG